MAVTKRNCIHMPVCGYAGQAYSSCEICPFYKDANAYYELPQPIGTTAYIVRKMRYDRDGYGMSFIYYWGIEKTKFNVRQLDMVGKNLFFDEKEAEEYKVKMEQQYPLDNY